MKQIASKTAFFTGAITAIGASALWATFWWRWVARAYDLAPAGNENLEHAIFNELGGTMFVGFVVFWFFRRIVCVWQGTQPPSVPPMKMIRFIAPSMPKVDPTSNQTIAYLWLRSAVNRTMTNAAYRLGRFIRHILRR